MSNQLINQYYNQLHLLKRSGISNEMAIKQPFDMLVLQMATQKRYIYATEVTIKNEAGKNVRPDGILMNELRIHKGYVESKDTGDSIDLEIEKKLYKDGYPKTNILFQDSITAVLIQDGEEAMRVVMQEADRLEAILKTFIEYKPQYLENFEEALEKFKADIPTIVETLRELLSGQDKTNPKYIRARDDFWEMCKQEINPQIKEEDIREMVIQHVLTEDLFKSVFDESDFHHENNIARELETLVNAFMTRDIRQNQLSELNHYYKTLNAQASSVADHHEKQRFLKVVYENFYKVYNPKGADRLGVVYTPNEIVDFMIRSTDHLLEKYFGRNLHDENVHILDPATGTGTFVTDLIEYIPAQYLEHKYHHEIHANEVAILPYYVANLNIEFTYKQKMGKYAEFPNICFVDTLDNTAALTWDRMGRDQGIQSSLFGGVSHENAQRIKRQNKQKISVVIGNPPYNANQANFNDFNKNREYPIIDDRIKKTFVKESTAQKTKVYDMYARFYRWAMDRLDGNGVIAFITNRSFIDSRTFDGFRKCIQRDFDHCYVVDTRSDVRANPKIAGTTHNVFGIQTGVAIMFLVKKVKKDIAQTWEQCRIYYNGELQDDWRKEQKLEWIKNKRFEDIHFENIIPSPKNDWINLTDNDWEELVPVDKIYHVISNGVSTNRDEWVFDLSRDELVTKSQFLVEAFNDSVRENRLDHSIKWSSALENRFKRSLTLVFYIDEIVEYVYRPFFKKFYYSNKAFSDRLTENHFKTFGDNLKSENSLICINTNGKDFHIFVSKLLVDLHTTGDCQYLPLYRYDTSGTRHDNITDWGLERFRNHYQIASVRVKPTRGKPDYTGKIITKEDIFHYTYGVLHSPRYRDKYALNLKRDFPRLPLYDNFFQWVDWGKQLMDLHIGYESVEPYPLKLVSLSLSTGDKPKAKLKAEKELGIIKLDEATELHGIPQEAWHYKLGNRSALEWILDQYKEKKPKDKTIAERFNTYHFADYKEHVIDLLMRVCTVSVETMKVVREMD